MLRFLCFVALVTAAVLAGVESVSIGITNLNCTANLQRADRFVGIGYNLLEADPDAAGGGGVDPGFLTKRRVVDLDPSGQESFLRHSCVTRSSTSTIYDEESFQKKFDLDVAVAASMSYKLVKAKFALSTSFSRARDQTTKQRKMTLEKQTLCNLGGARMMTELGVNRASQGFQAAVCQLPDTYDQGAYVKFINDWGTSFILEVDVGIRNLNKKTESFTSVFEKMRNAIAVNASASADYNGALASVSGSMEMNMNKVESSDKFSEFFTGAETTKEIGTEYYPEPIYVEVDSLFPLVTAAYLSSQNPSARTNAQLALLSTKELYLARALSISDAKVRIPLTWPRGTYGLLKSTHGCPDGWAADGQRTWNTEDDRNANKVTPDHHFDGYINSNIQLKFCVKTNSSTSPQNEMDWPAGKYCIYKFGECPNGFTEGSIFHDDEDQKPSNNSVSGTVPDGKYDLDTRMYFCCRSDSRNNDPIFLPTDKPFYLFQATKDGCQEVKGMLSRRETILWDDENAGNLNYKTGAVPWNDDSTNDWHLFMCYYFKYFTYRDGSWYT